MYTDEAQTEASTTPSLTDEHVEADPTLTDHAAPQLDDQPYVAEDEHQTTDEATYDAPAAVEDAEVDDTAAAAEDAPAEDAPVDEAPVEDAPADEAPVAVVEPVAVPESPVAASTRVLELATFTADQLVADAQAQADNLVASAQADAEQLRASSQADAEHLRFTSQADAEQLRSESREAADRAAGELARLREEQAADLDRERTAALSDLSEQKAALEALVDGLRQQESDYRSRLRGQLHEHLALLGDAGNEPTLSVAG